MFSRYFLVSLTVFLLLVGLWLFFGIDMHRLEPITVLVNSTGGVVGGVIGNRLVGEFSITRLGQ
jgi:hypothetical protein